MTDRFLRISDVVRKVGFSRTTIWRLRRDNGFPEPARIRGNYAAWSEADHPSSFKVMIQLRNLLLGKTLSAICSRAANGGADRQTGTDIRVEIRARRARFPIPQTDAGSWVVRTM